MYIYIVSQLSLNLKVNLMYILLKTIISSLNIKKKESGSQKGDQKICLKKDNNFNNFIFKNFFYTLSEMAWLEHLKIASTVVDLYPIWSIEVLTI